MHLKLPSTSRRHPIAFSCAAVLALLLTCASASAQTTPSCARTVKAEVVALDQVFSYNRLGAVNPSGMIYALKQDVVAIDPTKGLVAGNVRLRPDKRPRPIALRMNAGDCLRITFTNLLAPERVDDEQPATRTASVHVQGLQLVGSIASDGSNVGNVTPIGSLVSPDGTAVYTLFAQREGSHLLYSTAATTGGEGDGGSLGMGLFGSVNVEPAGAEWYRSQVTADELKFATKKDAAGNPLKTAGQQPIPDYDAVYPAGHPRAGKPVLKMLDASNNIVHTDLNAIITGPGKGRFPANTFTKVAVEPDREQPFREFTVVYHDEIRAVQAFPQFRDPVLKHTLHSVRDGFAINYGTGGVGAEILANRFGVGPMHACTECKYEEFFLSAWTVGDPAQVVDIPANALDPLTGQLKLGPKATKVLYPDDPSNVHHSYLNDHVKMRVLHAGPKEHHIHHLHAHQWIHTPDDDNSSYLDSQAIGPGSAFTLEIAHNGSGNKNKTAGDSIFHCHFYPHFAQGMWELWRVHDVFEAGTELDPDGRPTATARKLPDGEIMAGTPIPALVPLPTLAMAPMPTATFQGFPFYIPGVAGHRPPHPPLDTLDDGGLPRHIITGGIAHSVENRLDFDKVLQTANAFELSETGTAAEIAAMNFHAQRLHPSFKPDGAAASFVTNGLPAKPGAPFADPCVDNAGAAVGSPRTYKGVNIQLDMKFNKAGWHFPQQRIETLWEDARPTLDGVRPPEPFFFRANSNDCITFHHANLVPHVYQQDDFQIRTPTDIMGQHIHLVKFDVTSSDGSGNGWNYEDGTFSPGEVQERIHAINAAGGLLRLTGAKTLLTPREHPFFRLSGRDNDGNGLDDWLGAQTTIQRWYADPTLNMQNQDRTLRTVFTHDHYGPSTHQQVGFYAGLVVEPRNSTWRHPETGETFGTRLDGGPTSWRADILTSNSADSYREFLLEFGDFQLAYKAGGGGTAANPIADPANAINPPVKKEVGLPDLLIPAPICPGGAPLPCPEAISAAEPGTMVVNYRNEPLALRVRDPNTNSQATTAGGDLANAFSSKVNRADPAFNRQPNFYPPLTSGVESGDPFTPLLRVYENDKVQIRVLVGAHEEGHNFSVHGIKWLFEPSAANSGFRNSQMMGISEHFEFLAPIVPVENQNPNGGNLDTTNGCTGGGGGTETSLLSTTNTLCTDGGGTTTSAPDGGGSTGSFTDHLYKAGASVDDLWNGLWGLMRVYRNQQQSLLFLPSNPTLKGSSIANKNQFTGPCPNTAPTRPYEISAVTAAQALPGGKLVYNSRTNMGGQLVDPTAILYVRTNDLGSNGRLKSTVPIEPLVLRANAGDCVVVTLNNSLVTPLSNLPGFSTLPMIVNEFNANDVAPSTQVGLHSQLLAYNVDNSDGTNVGFNPVQTVKPNQRAVYRWYAGDLKLDALNNLVATPVEFGATNLIPADPIKHTNKGAIGALIIEPQGSTWVEDTASRAQATVTKPDGTKFREFVLLFQNDINLRFGDTNAAVPNLAEQEDAEDSGQKALNYRTEPLWKRLNYPPDRPLTHDGCEPGLPCDPTNNVDFTNSLNNAQVGGDPVTPIFTAKAGTPVRIRVLHPGGHQRNNVFQLHGHIWQEEPYTNASKVIGNNPLSEWKGTQMGHGPTNHMDVVLQNGAGGAFKVTGDYLYRDQQSVTFDGGMWGIFRVTP